MRAEGVFYADSDATAAAVAEAAQAWSLRVPAVRLWAQVARDMLPEAPPARWTIEFDPQMKLVPFDVWAGDRRVYGADDFLG